MTTWAGSVRLFLRCCCGIGRDDRQRPQLFVSSLSLGVFVSFFFFLFLALGCRRVLDDVYGCDDAPDATLLATHSVFFVLYLVCTENDGG